jgi:hypothetical protein
MLAVDVSCEKLGIRVIVLNNWCLLADCKTDSPGFDEHLAWRSSAASAFPPPPLSACLQPSVKNLAPSSPADIMTSSSNSTSMGCAVRHGNGCSANGTAKAATTEEEFAVCSRVDERKTQHAHDTPADSALSDSFYHDDLLQVMLQPKWPKPVDVEMPEHEIHSSNFETNAVIPIESTKVHTLHLLSTQTTPISLLAGVHDGPPAVYGEVRVSESGSEEVCVQDSRVGCNNELDNEEISTKEFSRLPFAQVRNQTKISRAFIGCKKGVNPRGLEVNDHYSRTRGK